MNECVSPMNRLEIQRPGGQERTQGWMRPLLPELPWKIDQSELDIAFLPVDRQPEFYLLSRAVSRAPRGLAHSADQKKTRLALVRTPSRQFDLDTQSPVAQSRRSLPQL